MACSCGCGKSGSPKEWSTEYVDFADLRPDESAEIVGYTSGGDLRYKSKLLSMGLVRGEKIKVLQVAPLGDPVEVAVMSYRLSLRKSEAAVLKLRRL